MLIKHIIKNKHQLTFRSSYLHFVVHKFIDFTYSSLCA